MLFNNSLQLINISLEHSLERGINPHPPPPHPPVLKSSPITMIPHLDLKVISKAQTKNSSRLIFLMDIDEKRI